MNAEKNNGSPVVFLVISASLLFGLSLSVRMNYGILLNVYADYAGLPYDKSAGL